MENNERPKLKACAVLEDRTRSFVNDGYIIRVMYSTPTLFVSRLRHRTNGNEITISGSPINNWYQQKTNGKFTVIHDKIV